MYETVKLLHSGLRFIILLLIALAIIQALAGWFGRKGYTEFNRKINLFTMVSGHVQFLLGLILYFLSPFVKYSDMGNAMKDGVSRYWTVEHAVLMIFALVLLTVGHSKSKKLADPWLKHRTIAIFYGIAAIVVLLAIYQSGRPLLGVS